MAQKTENSWNYGSDTKQDIMQLVSNQRFSVELNYAFSIKVLFIHQLMHQWVVLKKNSIKIYIKTALTCFGVTVTPSSGSALICAY